MEKIEKQTINFKALMRTVSRINVDQYESKWQFENALKSLDSRWSTIDTLHWEIEGVLGGGDSRYQAEFTKHEKLHDELTNTINTKMWSVSHRETYTPKMEIPVFDGNYNQWTSFKDLFNEVIHKSPSLSNAQKKQFLKGKVTREAERLIHHLQISSDNYEVCWEILKHRYDNQKRIFTSHINILLGLPSMQQKSLCMIKKLHDTTKECLHAIQNMGVDTTTWDLLLVHLLAQKLDNESFEDYMKSIRKPRELPILQEFLDLLLLLLLTQPQPIHENPRSFIQPSNHHTEEDNSNIYKSFHVSRHFNCAMCNADHELWRCPRFRHMKAEHKLKNMNLLNYCKNCLIYHEHKECFSTKRCAKCLSRHNTLLHEAFMKQSPKLNTKPFYYCNIALHNPSNGPHNLCDKENKLPTPVQRGRLRRMTEKSIGINQKPRYHQPKTNTNNQEKKIDKHNQNHELWWRGPLSRPTSFENQQKPNQDSNNKILFQR
ncbi:Uncharacterized protein OBRU01_18210 [Operophtera brumata]|uniref:Uncharacterized protein n=1 Tax=Operophtera brumata TaxID=104452 RepID=A0A0L7KW24_OPEBR|nr:Uncharacterized protein OBRU01_18210 [Operophtera brumata]